MSRRDDLNGLPPGPRLPQALQLVATWKRPAGSLLRLRQRYGKRFTVRIPFQPPFVMLSDPDAIRALYTEQSHGLPPGRSIALLPVLGPRSVLRGVKSNPPRENCTN